MSAFTIPANWNSVEKIRDRKAKGETFADVDRLLCDCVHRFIKKNGELFGDFEELKAEACRIYTWAYEKWTPARSKFTHYLRWIVDKQLLEVKRRCATKHGRLPLSRMPEDMDFSLPYVRDFDLGMFADSLSEDAGEVLLMIFGNRETGVSLKDTAAHDPNEVLPLLKEYLRDIGWASSRIAESFAEIRRAL